MTALTPYEYECFVQWFVNRLPGRRVVEGICRVICENHSLASRQRKMPWLTIANVAARRGKQNRNTPREILLEMAALEGSPFVLLPADRRSHTTGFFLHKGAWIAQASKTLMQPFGEGYRTYRAWRHKKRRAQFRHAMTKEYKARVVQLKAMLAIQERQKQFYESKSHTPTPDEKTLIARLEAKRAQLGIVLT